MLWKALAYPTAVDRCDGKFHKLAEGEKELT